MDHYKVIGIDLAKTKFHLAAFDEERKVIFKRAIKRDVFFSHLELLFPTPQTFAFEACAGCHYTAQRLQALGHKVIVLKPKDVKPYAKSRQKNDHNDAVAICKAACDPELMHVAAKTKQQQEVAYLHKARQNTIQQRIQRSNSLMASLQEFGFRVKCGKSTFAKKCETYLKEAFAQDFISAPVYEQMTLDCQEIQHLLTREKGLDKEIIRLNKASPAAQLLITIAGIGPLNASMLSNKPMSLYKKAKDFSASLGLVPKQNTTGGNVRLGSITKQGDRYARTILIQAARSLVMQFAKSPLAGDKLHQFIARLKQKRKPFNVICVAVANKLSRIAYACLTKNTVYNPLQTLKIK